LASAGEKPVAGIDVLYCLTGRIVAGKEEKVNLGLSIEQEEFCSVLLTNAEIVVAKGTVAYEWVEQLGNQAGNGVPVDLGLLAGLVRVVSEDLQQYRIQPEFGSIGQRPQNVPPVNRVPRRRQEADSTAARRLLLREVGRRIGD
jgi:hypothetical protein